MIPIDQDIITNFNQKFCSIKQEPIVLYGTGEKTKLILEHCTDFNFIGIMDRNPGKEAFGLPILTENAIKGVAKYIIIVCNVSSMEIIFQRIASFAQENNIEVYHINGRRLVNREKSELAKELVLDKNAYETEILEHDVVSFDLFDTLIMRKCLYADDLFEIMARKLGQPDFSEKRKSAEKKAISKHGASYTLYDIYQIYVSENNQHSKIADQLPEIEFQLEVNYMQPRKEVVQLLHFAKQHGKQTILTSDMYMTREQIKNLLQQCGILENCFDNIYISNEMAMTKADGSLWKYISKKYSGYRIVHFGDNPVSDLENARKAGMDALPIYSPAYMASVLFGNIWNRYENNFDCRCIMGSIAANLFHSPFDLDPQGRLKINSLETVGYNFFGPLVKYFMDQLYHSVKEKGQKILFSARDCWILKLIADKFYTEYNIPSEYFLTSRRAISIATTQTDSDIEDAFAIFGNAVQYTFQKFCKIIFNIDISEKDPYYDKKMASLDKNTILQYLKEQYGETIKQTAKKQHAFYKTYIDSLHIDLNENLAIINFVGSGITQSLFEKFGFGENSEYYYFAMTPLNVELHLKSQTHSLFQSGSIYTSSHNPIVEYTVLGECIFSSPKSQFMGFWQDNEPVFADEGINLEYEKIEKAHFGIENYFETLTHLDIHFQDVPSEFINGTYGLLFDSDICSVSAKVRDAFQMKDIVKSNQICKIWSD